MLFNGEPLSCPTVMVKLRGGKLNIMIKAIPSGLHELAEDLFPIPLPPTEIIKKEGTGITVTDDNGRPLERKMVDDPEWIKAERDAETMQTMVFLEHALSGGGSITIEADRSGSDQDYYRDFAKELGASGLTKGEITYITRKMFILTQYGEEELEESSKSFRDTPDVSEGDENEDEKSRATEEIVEAAQEIIQDDEILTAPRGGENGSEGGVRTAAESVKAE